MKLRIAELAKERGMTLQDIADKMQVARSTLANTLSKGNPTLETLEKIATSLDVSVIELFEQPKKDGTSITCPKCGADIKIKVE